MRLPGILSILLGAASVAQVPIPTPPAGSPRWIVTFKTRSFDLEPYREAVRAGAQPAAFDQVVAALEARMRDDQRPFVQFAEALGGRITHQWWLVNALALELDPRQLPALRAHENVASVVPDQKRTPGIKTATNAQNHASDALTAAGIKGRGVTIAVVDSGVDENMSATGRPHATFYVNGNVNDRTGGGIQGSRLLVNRRVGAMSPDDIIAHGTMVAAIAAGETWNQTIRADNGHAPLASIASYCVADDASGGAFSTTLTNAWQAVATDRQRFNITVANCSYDGYYDLGFPDQQAIDALAWNGDVSITVMAGNEGATGNRAFVYSSTNVIAVGATAADTRLVTTFSSVGPVLGTGRFYPDLVANGDAVVGPLADNEASDKTGSGTSYSAPQVAGAAALFRSLRPTATAGEVKAALLVTSEDVSGKNRVAPRDTRNAYGLGYLRIDEAAKVASGPSLSVNSLVTPAQPITFRHGVIAGRHYGVAVVWFRKNAALASWSNLDLRVVQNGVPIAESRTPENLAEMVRFIAPGTGLADITVSCVTLETGTTSQPFALVATEVLPFYVEGRFAAGGAGCPAALPLRLLSGTLVPEVGRTYDVILATSRVQYPYVLLLGASNAQWGSLALPFALDPLGAPGCSLYVSPDLANSGITDNAGGATLQVAVPLDRALVSASVFHQGLVADVSANALGLAFSGYLRATVGGQR